MKNFLSKINNSFVIAAIALLIVFSIFLSLSAVLLSQKYFVDMDYVCVYKREDEPYKTRYTYTFNEYGQVRGTSTTLYGGSANYTSTSYSTYKFHDNSYDPQNELSSFEINSYLGALRCRTAFQLEYGDMVFVNYGAIFLLIFYILMFLSSLIGALMLLIHHNRGRIVFGATKRLEAKIDELQKQVDELKKGE